MDVIIFIFFVKYGKNIVLMPLKPSSESKSGQLIAANLLLAHLDCNLNISIKEVEGAKAVK